MQAANSGTHLLLMLALCFKDPEENMKVTDALKNICIVALTAIQNPLDQLTVMMMLIWKEFQIMDSTHLISFSNKRYFLRPQKVINVTHGTNLMRSNFLKSLKCSMRHQNFDSFLIVWRVQDPISPDV